MNRNAVLLSVITIILWSTLALIVSQLNHVTPFLNVGIALSIGGLIGVVKIREWRIPIKTVILGIYGLFGYHYLLFTAFKYAPAIETNLLNYLWPLLIVLLSPVFLAGYQLRFHHVIGAIVGFIGAGLIVSGGKLGLDIGNLKGYLFAASAAFIWASYSLLTKRVKPFPSAAVSLFCLVSGILSLGIYFYTQPSLQEISSLSTSDWINLIALGVGPMGLAFLTWDGALKRGDPRIIGALSYLTPMLSTFNLIAWGGKSLTIISVVAMVLILFGAVIGSLDISPAGRRITL